MTEAIMMRKSVSCSLACLVTVFLWAVLFTGDQGKFAHALTAKLALLYYKQTISCRIVSWARKPCRARNNGALRHISRAWPKPQSTLIGTSH
jgi:hypothetical protein